MSGFLSRWLDARQGTFELTEWQEIAIMWHTKKKRSNRIEDESGSTEDRERLHRALLCAFPGISMLKEHSVKDTRNIFKTKVYKCSAQHVKGRNIGRENMGENCRWS